MDLQTCAERLLFFFHGKIYNLMKEKQYEKLTANEFIKIPEAEELKTAIDVLYKYFPDLEGQGR